MIEVAVVSLLIAWQLWFWYANHLEKTKMLEVIHRLQPVVQPIEFRVEPVVMDSPVAKPAKKDRNYAIGL